PTPWAVAPLLDLAHGLAEVLAAVHRRGVVHRDVSPANILVPGSGPPVLIDFDLAASFGTARGSGTGEGGAADWESTAGGGERGLAGTLPYLAPEQTGRTGRQVDHRADLYGL